MVAEAGEPESAARELTAIAARADEREAWTLRSEATLHLARLELERGRRAKAGELAQKLATDASARGWTAMAQKAASVLDAAERTAY